MRARALLTLFSLLTLLALAALPAVAEEIDCVTTEWKLLGANHKVCVNAFDDPEVPCVTCYMRQARTGVPVTLVTLAVVAGWLALR